jgi:hypothetical protein
LLLAPPRLKRSTLPRTRFAALAEHLTLIEQIEADSARGSAARDFKLPDSRPRPKPKSPASKSAARSRANAVSPFRAPPHQKGIFDASLMPISPSGSIF